MTTEDFLFLVSFKNGKTTEVDGTTKPNNRMTGPVCPQKVVCSGYFTNVVYQRFLLNNSHLEDKFIHAIYQSRVHTF